MKFTTTQDIFGYIVIEGDKETFNKYIGKINPSNTHFLVLLGKKENKQFWELREKL